MRKNPRLKKCGYEYKVQLVNDTDYSLKMNGSEDKIGINLDVGFFSLVKINNVDLGNLDFLDITLKIDEKVNIFYKCISAPKFNKSAPPMYA